MNTKMYVGNLSWDSNEQDVREAFAPFGTVTEVFLPMDRETGRPRGFAFVSMDSRPEMEAAMRGLDGKEFQGRALTVNEARAREERPAYSGGGGGGGGGQRNGGGGGGGGYDKKRSNRY